MAQFMLLLHENPASFAGVTPEQMEQVIGEYVAWRVALEKQGRFVGAEKLRDEGGRHLTGTGEAFRVVDGPFAEAAEVIGGYFTVEAKDYDEAVGIAKDCPHLKYGGRIELRQVEPTGAE
ncbi:MAG: YciI family protein [Vicinamibacteria bacterium]|nr:YciI family protein [Vicinamibacteria bacterium]